MFYDYSITCWVFVLEQFAHRFQVALRNGEDSEKIINRLGSGIAMDTKKKLWRNLKLHTELNPELTLHHHLELLIEQMRIERHAFQQEIDELRKLLQAHKINDNTVESGINRSDKILDRLLRYEQGRSGKLVKKGIHMLPYRWRRKFRNAML